MRILISTWNQVIRSNVSHKSPDHWFWKFIGIEKVLLYSAHHENPRMHWTMFFRSYIFSILKKHQCTTSSRLDLKKLNNKWNIILKIYNRKPSKVITFIVSKVILVKFFYLCTIICLHCTWRIVVAIYKAYLTT